MAHRIKGVKSRGEYDKAIKLLERGLIWKKIGAKPDYQVSSSDFYADTVTSMQMDDISLLAALEISRVMWIESLVSIDESEQGVVDP